MRRPKPKSWPTSFRHAAAVGGTMTFKGRSFEVEYVVLPVRVEAADPQELGERIEEAIVEGARLQRPS